jgi:MFS family permease
VTGRQPSALHAGRARLFFGISVIWVPLAFVFDGVTVLMLPLRLGGDASELGLVSLAGLGIAAGLQPVAGSLSDRYRDRVDRRLFLVLGATAALAGVWALAGSTGIVVAVIGYVIVQVGATALQAAQQTFIPEYVGKHQQGRAAGLKTAFDVGGAFLAFAVFGTVLAAGSLVPAALVVTVVLVAAIAVVLTLVPRVTAIASRTGSERWTLSLPTGLAPLIASRFLFLFGTYAVGRFLLLLVAERLGVAPDRAVGEAGWLLALFTLATAVAAVPLGWVADRRPRRELMAAGSLVAVLGILVLVPGAGLPGVMAGGLLMSFGTAAFVTGNWAATTAVVPAAESGRLMAIANLGTGLAAAAAGALGPLIDAWGFAPGLVIAAAATVLSMAPLVRSPFRQAISQEHVT